MRLFRYILLLLLAASPCAAQQAITPAQLNPAAALTGSESIPLQQGSHVLKTTPAAIATYSFSSSGLATNSVTTIPQSGYRPEGDDVTASSDSGGATIRFVNPLASDLGVQVTNNRGTQGAMACDMANLQTIQNENPGASGNPLYTVEAGINDAFYKGAGSYVTGVYRRCMQSTLSWLSIPSTSKTYFNNCTLVGSWGHSSYASFSFPFSDVAGDTISCNFTTTGGPVYLWYDMQDARGSAAFNYNIDSGTITGSVNAFTSPSISTHNGGQEGVGLTRITGVSAGSHNLLLTTTSSGGSGFVVPYAIGTVPASFTTSTPLVFVSGVPQQQNNANSTNTSAYDTEVATDVTTLGPSGDGLPIYEYNIRNATNSPLGQINNTTDMSTPLFFANSGQSKIVQGFYNLISSTITGGAVSTVISPSSGGLGLNASALSGAVSFNGGAATIGNLGISTGGTGSTTAQGALNNLFGAPTSSAAPVVAQCTGKNDEVPILAAINTACATRSSVIIPTNSTTIPTCLIQNQLQVPSSCPYVNLISWSGPWGEGPQQPQAGHVPSIGIDNASIAANVPSHCAMDVNGAAEFNISGITPVGFNGSQSSSNVVICNSQNHANWGGTNIALVQLTGSGTSAMASSVGCPVNDALNDSVADNVSMTGTQSGTTMTVSAVANGTIKVGDEFYIAGSNYLAYVTALVGGTGGAGTYTMSTSQTVSSATNFIAKPYPCLDTTPNYQSNSVELRVITSQFANVDVAFQGNISDPFIERSAFSGMGGSVDRTYGNGGNGGDQIVGNRFEFIGSVTPTIDLPGRGGVIIVGNNFQVFGGTGVPGIRTGGASAYSDFTITGNDFSSWRGDATGSYILLDGTAAGEGAVVVTGNTGNANIGFGGSNHPAHWLTLAGTTDNNVISSGNSLTGFTGSFYNLIETPLTFSALDIGTSQFQLGQKIGMGTQTPVVSLDMSGSTDALALPRGPSSTRPISPIDGMLRENTSLTQIEAYINGAWGQFIQSGKQIALNVFNASLVPLTIISQANANLPTSGLAYYWKFDENTGSSVADAVGSNTGTWQGTLGSQWTTGIINSGGNFLTANSNYVSTTTNAAEPTVFSISAWFKTTSTLGHKMVGIEINQTGTSCSNLDYSVYVGTDGLLYFQVFASGNTFISGPKVNDGNWHHVVATESGTVMSLYLDGQLQSSAAKVSTSGFSGYWRIGGYCNALLNGTNGFFNGAIDEVGIYTTVALTPSQVSFLYNLGVGNQYPFTPETQSADLLDFKNSAGSILSTFSPSGSLGIGTSNPLSKLTVTGIGTTAPLGTSGAAGYACVDSGGNFYTKTSSCP